MTDLKIDEKALRRLHDILRKFIDFFEKDIDMLIDKDEDIFLRYKAFSRAHCYCNMLKCSSELFHSNFILGFDLNHDIFKTKKLAKHGFDKIKIENNPFFINEDSPSSEIEKILNKILEEVE